MRSWEDIRADELREMFPTHDIWTVLHTTCRHTTWCSRPKGTPTATLNCDSADELQGEISRELAGLPPTVPDVTRIGRKYGP
jgi:hypothetical protein